MEYISCMGHTCVSFNIFRILQRVFFWFWWGFCCLVCLFICFYFVLILFYFIFVKVFYFTEVYTDSREKGVRVSCLVHLPNFLLLQQSIAFLRLHYFTTTSLLPFCQTRKCICQFCSKLLRKMSETEWGLCRESGGAPLALLELPHCEGASVSVVKVSGVGSVTPGGAPGWSDSKVSLTRCIAEPVSHLEPVVLCNSINHR